LLELTVKMQAEAVGASSDYFKSVHVVKDLSEIGAEDIQALKSLVEGRPFAFTGSIWGRMIHSSSRNKGPRYDSKEI